MLDYRLRQRDYLLAISRAMTSRLDVRAVLRLILESAAELLGADVALIAVRDNQDSFRIRAAYGIPSQMLHLFTPLLEDIPVLPAGWSIPDLSWRLHLVSTAAGLPLRQVIALPMMIGDQLIGVIYVFRLTGLAFSEDDRQVLASFADQAAIAIHNARLYQQLLAEKRRLDAIIEHSADGIMILDARCRVEVINRALERMTGWRAGDAVGRHCSEVLTAVNAQGQPLCGRICTALERAEEPAGAEETLYLEGDIVRPDGSKVSIGINHSLLWDEEGRLLNIILDVHDITRFRQAEELQSTFISVISHELKTPVALIKGYASTLSREDAHWDEATVREGLRIIEEESDRLDQLINNLLDASRIQAGGLKLELTDVSLPRLAEKIVNRLRTQTSVHRFELAFPPDFPPVFADEERISQVLYNLLNNAVKYSPRGGTIRVGGQALDREVLVYVSDEGIGIPKEEQDHLFQRFYRVDSGLRRQTPGVGLGLYLSRAIIEAHGGRIWVESEAGKGATFYFTLPRIAA
jgi:PAS domain S-box-containing protein